MQLKSTQLRGFSFIIEQFVFILLAQNEHLMFKKKSFIEVFGFIFAFAYSSQYFFFLQNNIDRRLIFPHTLLQETDETWRDEERERGGERGMRRMMRSLSSVAASTAMSMCTMQKQQMKQQLLNLTDTNWMHFQVP